MKIQSIGEASQSGTNTLYFGVEISGLPDGTVFQMFRTVKQIELVEKSFAYPDGRKEVFSVQLGGGRGRNHKGITTNNVPGLRKALVAASREYWKRQANAARPEAVQS